MSSITDLLYDNNRENVYDIKPLNSFVQGVVTENNDKKFPGMVKVEFTAWEKGKNIYQWIPVLSQYGGKEWGSYIIPEIKDIVIVGFINGSSDKPFILGSLYPEGSEIVSKSFDEKNLKKCIKTKGGIDISISDEDKKQAVKLVTPKEMTIDVSDETETIKISDKGNKNSITINCKDGKMILSADTSIEIKCGKSSIELNGKSGAVEIECNSLKINAKQTAEIKSSQLMTIEGNMVKVEGKQTLTAKGSAMTEISGGMVKIN